MSARVLGLGIAAALVSIGAAWLDSDSTPRRHVAPEAARPSPTPAPVRAKRVGTPVVTAARAYTLAARTWSAATFERSWRRELELTAGSYRRALLAARPTRTQLAALRADGAASRATVVRVVPKVEGARARVVVELEERTRSRGQQVDGVTRNEVRLRRIGERWRVVAFSALPGEAR
jgi:hypothetical protein